MPRASNFREKLVVRVENLSSVLFLPVFFGFTGLRTQIGLLDTGYDWAICGIIIGVATVSGNLAGAPSPRASPGWMAALRSSSARS